MDFSSGHASVMMRAFKPKAMGSSSDEETFPPSELIFFSSFSFNWERLVSGDSGIILILTAAIDMDFVTRGFIKGLRKV